MADQKLNVQLTLDASGMIQGLSVATKGVDTAAQNIKRGFKGAADGTDSVSDSLRTFKTEATQASRVANFYAKDLAAIAPGAGAAGFALKELATAALSGSAGVAGFAALVGGLALVKEKLDEEKKLAIEVGQAHIDAVARVNAVYRNLSDSIGGTMTKSMAAAKQIAGDIRASAVEAEKASVKTMADSGGAVDSLKNFGNLTVDTLGLVASRAVGLGFVFEMLTQKMGPLFKTSFDRVGQDWKMTDDLIGVVDGNRAKARKNLADEDVKLNQENADKILEIAARTSDRIVQIDAETKAKINEVTRSTPKDGPGADAAGERAAQMKKAIQNDADIQIARFREDQEQEANNRAIQLADQFATEDVKILDAANIKAAQLKIDAYRSGEPAMTALLLQSAEREERSGQESYERSKRIRLQAIDDEYVQVVAKKQMENQRVLTDYSRAQDQMKSLHDANGDKELADEILRAREAGDARAKALNEAEEKGLLSHAQFLLELKQNESVTTKEIGDAWTKTNSKWANDFIKPLASGFSSAVKGMIHQTQSIGQAIEGLGMSIVDALIDGAIKVGLKELEEAVLSHATTAVKNVAAVTSYAAVGGAAAASAVAGIPIIGPGLALAAGTATSAEILAAFAAPAGASGGFDVPAGINPVTQLHQKEMVLPAHLADPLRDALSGGRLGGGGDQHIHIRAWDGQDVMRVVQSQPFQRAVAMAKRNGAWAG